MATSFCFNLPEMIIYDVANDIYDVANDIYGLPTHQDFKYYIFPYTSYFCSCWNVVI